MEDSVQCERQIHIKERAVAVSRSSRCLKPRRLGALRYQPRTASSFVVESDEFD